jgi:hypothetical protein
MNGNIENVIVEKFGTALNFKKYCKARLTTDEYGTMRSDLVELKKMLKAMDKKIDDPDVRFQAVLSMYCSYFEAMESNVSVLFITDSEFNKGDGTVSTYEVYKSLCFVECLRKKMLMMIKSR